MRELRPATASSAKTNGPEHCSHRTVGAGPGFLSVMRRPVSTAISNLLFLFTAPLRYFGAGRAKPGFVPARAPYGVILSQVGRLNSPLTRTCVGRGKTPSGHLVK